MQDYQTSDKDENQVRLLLAHMPLGHIFSYGLAFLSIFVFNSDKGWVIKAESLSAKSVYLHSRASSHSPAYSMATPECHHPEFLFLQS